MMEGSVLKVVQYGGNFAFPTSRRIISLVCHVRLRFVSAGAAKDSKLLGHKQGNMQGAQEQRNIQSRLLNNVRINVHTRCFNR